MKPPYMHFGAFFLRFLQLAQHVRSCGRVLLTLVVFYSSSPGLPAQEEPIAIPGVVSLQGGRVNPQSYWGTVVSATHDSQQLVTRTSRGAQVWNLDDSTLESEFPVAGFTVNERFALAKDRSRVIAFVSDSKTRQPSLVCMSLPDRETIWSNQGTQPGPLRFAPDESTFALWNEQDQALELYESDSGVQLLSLNAGRKFLRTFDLAFSPSGNLIAPTTNGIELVIWNLEDGDWQLELSLARTRLRQVEFVDETSLLFAGRSFTPPDKTTWHLKLVGTDVGETIFDIGEQFDTDDFEFFALSPNQKRLVTIHASKLMVWNLSTRQLEREIKRLPVGSKLRGGRNSQGAAISPDGSALYLSAGTSLQTWDLDTGELKSAPEEKHLESVSAIAVNRKQTRIATGGQDGRVLVWEGKTGRLLRALDCSKMGIYAVEFIPRTTRLAVVGDYSPEGRISAFLQTYDYQTGESSHRVELFGQQQTLAVSADGTKLYATSSKAKGNTVASNVQTPDRAMYGGFVGGGSRLHIAAFDARTLEPAREFRGPIGGFNRKLRLQRDSKRLAFMSNSQLSSWSLTNGEQNQTLSFSEALGISPPNKVTPLFSEVDFESHTTFVTLMGFSRMQAPKHPIVAIDSSSQKVRWRVESERIPRNLLLSPNGKMLVVGLGGGDSLEWDTILVLSPDDGTEMFRFDCGNSPMTSMRFTNDSQRLLGGRMIGDFLVWDLEATAKQARVQ